MLVSFCKLLRTLTHSLLLCVLCMLLQVLTSSMQLDNYQIVCANRISKNILICSVIYKSSHHHGHFPILNRSLMEKRNGPNVFSDSGPSKFVVVCDNSVKLASYLVDLIQVAT